MSFSDPFWHHCPFTARWIGSASAEMLDCRCFESTEFFELQDQIALAVDARRALKRKA